MQRSIPRLLAISDRRRQRDGDLEPWFRSLARSPVDTVQIREKDLSDRDLLALVSRARSLLPKRITLVVNGRVDIAQAARADGVHLPANGLPVDALRRRFGPELLIGVSTHSQEEIVRAVDAGADYATFGPVWSTPSKAAYGPPAGIAALEEAARLGLPVLALGGVTIERVPAALHAGAAGVAAIGMFREPSDPALTRLAALSESSSPTR